MAYIGLHRTIAANGTRSRIGLNPKSSPIASHTPRMVCDRRGRATILSCAFITSLHRQIFVLFTEQEPCQFEKPCMFSDLPTDGKAEFGFPTTCSAHQLGIPASCCKC